jgi:hypothetical protein
MFSSANKTWKRQSWYWHQIWLDCEQLSENTISVLLGLDSAKELNRKDTKDFILFPTDIHVPSSDQWFRRYALSKLMNAAEILWRIDQRETDNFEFLAKIRN